jgi:hypothetical protein
MRQKLKRVLVFILAGLWLLTVSAFLTLAINQTRQLTRLYTVSAAPPPAIDEAGNLLRPGGANDLLVLVVMAVVLFLLVFRRPRRLVIISIGAGLLFFVLNLYSGRHLLPQLLIWPSPVSLSEQYVQAVTLDDLETTLCLTDRSSRCETVMRQLFQDHRRQWGHQVDLNQPGSVIDTVSVERITTYYEKPVAPRVLFMQPPPHQLATLGARLENGRTVWLNLKMSYRPFFGRRYLCGDEMG